MGAGERHSQARDTGVGWGHGHQLPGVVGCGMGWYTLVLKLLLMGMWLGVLLACLRWFRSFSSLLHLALLLENQTWRGEDEAQARPAPPRQQCL